VDRGVHEVAKVFGTMAALDLVMVSLGIRICRSR
jgi:hypothetical protein